MNVMDSSKHKMYSNEHIFLKENIENKNNIILQKKLKLKAANKYQLKRISYKLVSKKKKCPTSR